MNNIAFIFLLFLTCTAGLAQTIVVKDNQSHIIYSNEELIRIFSTLIQRNVQLLGNCLGSKEDLIYALVMFVRGEMPITIDSAYQGSQVQDFFNRTFNESNKFGKVVYIY
ncbi:hypothetical protein G6M26_26945 [Agrobacterium tumefaciens]|nr:hypothetical protein [Agrobacterium tumefaciens]NTE22192.1 hypothetical protein [Agrobacterium tumefaciens]